MPFISRTPDGLHDAWRYIVGILLVFLFYSAGQLPFYVVMKLKGAPVDDPGMMADFSFSDYGIDTNVGFLLLLTMFVFALIGLFVVVVRLHDRSLLSLINPTGKIRYRRIGAGFLFWLLANLVLELISYGLDSENYTFQFHAGPFVVLLLISLVVLPLQTSFEELFFRGYMMQGMAVLASRMWIPALLSSIVFGLMHIANPEIKEYGWQPMLLFYISAGFFLAYVAIQDQGLELSIGLHTATNFFGAVFVNYEGSVLQTDALFLSGKAEAWPMVITFWVMASIFIFWAGRKYQWVSPGTFFSQKMLLK